MDIQDSELKKMTLVIAGRSYPVKVTKEEALMLPTLEKDLNDQIQRMQMTYRDKDMQDCLTMVLLTQAISNQKHTTSITPDLSQKIDALNQQIESTLS